MTKPSNVWRTIFVLLLIGVIIKFWLLFSGSILLFSVARWVVWVGLLIAIYLLWMLYRLIFLGQQTLRYFLTWWIGLALVLFVVGFATKSIHWVGTWQLKPTVSGKVVGTTSDGLSLIPCESDPDQATVAPPAGVNVKMSSTPYNISSDGQSLLYDDNATGYSVLTFSKAKLDLPSKKQGELYTTSDLPEGDVFFRSYGEIGFIVGKDAEMQVCSTDAKMLSGQALTTKPTVYTAERGKDVSAVTLYLKDNHRVWGPGKYRAYGYIYDGSKWLYVAKSEVFTITE